jgi:predicted Fe-Mo cluster-binding NifX family protein
VFDVAQTVLMVETKRSGNAKEQVVGLPLGSPSAKVAFLTEQEVAVLVCGAISRQVRALAEADGIQVYPFVAGEIRDVVDAWMHDRLDQVSYSMPGCRRCRHQIRQRSGRNNK